MNGKQQTLKNLVPAGKITVKIGDLVNSYESLMRLSNKTFPMITSFKIARAYKVSVDAVKKFEDFKDGLRKQYATEKIAENGAKTYEFGANLAKAEMDIEKEMMLEIEVAVSLMNPKDFDGAQIEPKVLSDLDWLIKE